MSEDGSSSTVKELERGIPDKQQTWLDFFRSMASRASLDPLSDDSSKCLGSGGRSRRSLQSSAQGSSAGSIFNELESLQQINRNRAGTLGTSHLLRRPGSRASLRGRLSMGSSNAGIGSFFSKHPSNWSVISDDSPSIKKSTSSHRLSVASGRGSLNSDPSSKSSLSSKAPISALKQATSFNEASERSFKIELEEVDDLDDSSIPRVTISRVYSVTDESEDEVLGCHCNRQQKWCMIVVALLLAASGVASGLVLVYGSREEGTLSEGRNDQKYPGNNSSGLKETDEHSEDEAYGLGGHNEEGGPASLPYYDGNVISEESAYTPVGIGDDALPDEGLAIPSSSRNPTLPPSKAYVSTNTSPSIAPSLAPSSTLYNEMLHAVSNVTQSEYLLPDSDQPQHQALKFLAYEDPTNPLPKTNSFLPRYILTTLFFATGGDNWTSSTNWLVRSDVCMWHGVYCKLHLQGNSRRRVVAGLKLSRNNLVGVIPAEIGFLEHLENLYLDVNELSGIIPESIGHLKHLSNLSLSRNMLGGQLPTTMGQIAKLERFLCNENQVEGTLPTELGRLRNLQQLHMFGNKLQGKFTTELGKLSTLSRLWISGNELSGTIPTQVGNMSNLLALYLDDNSFTGTLPTDLGNATLLEDVRLYSNSFTGELPESFAQLQNLRIIYLDGNHLNGTLPPWFGRLTNLEYLDLSSNRISGTLPPELGNATAIVKLCLDENKIGGNVPTTLAQLRHLDELKLELNDIVGSIPDSMCAIGISDFSVDCNVSCPCCSYCMKKYQVNKWASQEIDAQEHPGVQLALFTLSAVGVVAAITGTIYSFKS